MDKEKTGDGCATLIIVITIIIGCYLVGRHTKDIEIRIQKLEKQAEEKRI